MKKRAAIEPVIGHLKCDHRMDRCRYKGADGDTVNVVWATVSWNTKKSFTSTEKGRKTEPEGDKKDRISKITQKNSFNL